ncbi:MAG: XRE family transcriptional regulator [Nitratireductor rhodophyticola]|uniref:helix-turn-helix domain-containing protein n=1 Tax=Nitratireductor rhodophyticola TaxID=2854036 RepID=UPI0032D8F884
MRTGVPNFVGSRLTEARAARGISSRKALADLIDKAPSTVSRWEEGELQPEPAAVEQLAQVLNLPVPYFLVGSSRKQGTSFFRSLQSALKMHRGMQKVQLSWLMEITDALEEFAELPGVQLPADICDGGFLALRDEDIERAAMRLREEWGLGSKPILNVVRTLEDAGIVVASDLMETTKLDGLSGWDESSARPFILLASDKQSFARRQFDAAHELGHIVMHRRVGEADLEKHFRTIEDQAHRFAAAFLLPADQYPLEVAEVTLWSLERLKSRWKVSIKAQIVRLKQLNIIDEEHAVRLYRAYSAKGYSKGEPLDDVWELQEPSLLSDVIHTIVEVGDTAKQELLEHFTLGASDIERLTRLPRGWFANEPARVVRLRDYR